MAIFKQIPASEARAKMRSTERRTDLKIALEDFFGEFLPENEVTLPLTGALVCGEDEEGYIFGLGWDDFPGYIRDAVNKREKNAGMGAIAGGINRNADNGTFMGTWAVLLADKDADDKHSGSIVLYPSKDAAKKSGHKTD
jgi:hypothetical protein